MGFRNLVLFFFIWALCLNTLAAQSKKIISFPQEKRAFNFSPLKSKIAEKSGLNWTIAPEFNTAPLSKQDLENTVQQLKPLEWNKNGQLVRFEANAPISLRSNNQFNWEDYIMNKVSKEENELLSFKIFEHSGQGTQVEHIKMRQYFDQYPVYGQEMFLHYYKKENNVLAHGQIEKLEIEPISPKITVEQALSSAKLALKQNYGQDIEPSQLSFSKNGLKFSAIEYWKTTSGEWHLVYVLKIQTDPLHVYQVLVDATNSTVLQSQNVLCKAHSHGHESHPEKILGDESASGRDLLGVTRNFRTWKEGSLYYMMDGSRVMFNLGRSVIPDDPVGAIMTIDALNTSPSNTNFRYDYVKSSNNSWSSPTAVSAHYNGSRAYEYFLNVFNRNSINGNGGTIYSVINVADENGRSMDNAFWNGEAMFYGNGSQAFSPLAKGLDVAGHEMSHGVIQGTANLEYKGESGAINESFADIFGAMIDRDDWKMGEDVVNRSVFPSGALRDLSNPHNGGNRLGDNGWQPAHVNEQYRGTEDEGGVHINSGICNFAYYKFIQELVKLRSEEEAKKIGEQVYYLALTKYLTRSSQFKQLRTAVEDAIKEKYSAVADVLPAAQKAFDAVGILGTGGSGGGGGGVTTKELSPNPGKEFVLCTDNNQDGVYIVDLSGGNATQINQRSVISKPSVTDNGAEIYFVDDNNDLYGLFLNQNTGRYDELLLDENNRSSYRNAVISKDGRLLAVLLNSEENFIHIYNFDIGEWKSYKLFNPTYTQGVNTGDVKYADFMDFDLSSQSIMYDAFSEIKQTSGSVYNYWDIGFLNVYNSSTKQFGTGKIDKLFSDLPENTSIGNAIFSKNSPNIIAFDYIEEGFSSTTNALLGANIETNDVAEIVANRTQLAYPSYNIKDNKVLFDDGANISQIGITSSKISRTGSPGGLINGAKWGTFFGNGKRSLINTKNIPLVRDIKFGPNPVVDHLFIELELEQPLVLKINLFDGVGKVINEKTVEMSSGVQKMDYSLAQLPAGYYSMVIWFGNTPKTIQLVK